MMDWADTAAQAFLETWARAKILGAVAGTQEELREALAKFARIAEKRGQEWRREDGPRYRHVKTGGTYQIVGYARLQSATPICDYADLVLYRSDADGSIWARGRNEFMDGRFERLPPPPEDAHKIKE